MVTRQIKEQRENEIDLMEFVRKLINKRKFILKITVVFACLGIMVAVFGSKEYVASCTMVPQTGEKGGNNGLGDLAAMAGISLGSVGGGDVLSPKIYPKILSSVPFQKELMLKKIKFDAYEQPVRLLDYYTDDAYRKFSLKNVVVKYTIGLPGMVVRSIRGERPVPVVPEESGDILTLSNEENECMKILRQKIVLNINDKDGVVTLSTSMPEPVAAAQLAAIVQSMLQRYITEFKIEKAQAKLKFVEERYAEAKKQFEVKQEELAQFKDANRNFASAVARTNEERLNNEYSVAWGVYNELAKQREQANIQVKEDTPVFTIVEPVTVPRDNPKSRRGIVVLAFTFLGGVLGIVLVLVLPFLAEITGCKRLSSWLPDGSQDCMLMNL